MYKIISPFRAHDVYDITFIAHFLLDQLFRAMRKKIRQRDWLNKNLSAKWWGGGVAGLFAASFFVHAKNTFGLENSFVYSAVLVVSSNPTYYILSFDHSLIK